MTEQQLPEGHPLPWDELVGYERGAGTGCIGDSVAYTIYGTDGNGRPSKSYSSMPAERFAQLYQPSD